MCVFRCLRDFSLPPLCKRDFYSFFVCLTREDGSDKLSRNVGKYQSTLRNMPEEQRHYCCLFIVFCISTTYLQQQADVRTTLTLQFTAQFMLVISFNGFKYY